ncbi:D-ribitol-5-phosphate cytidylyltransferase isoform X1 [Patella vulgata]|uniref:D-ribitol-5-phosphate cytidylyltransferase isoform X1 n=1 Tax=Patella vulgata TaxID=6465 RepID=UPI00217F57CC|nr:D-ribitol-5-phosphate cytidylyltransferase isoform X1 [Patella vulgata]
MSENGIDFNVGVILPAGGTGERMGLHQPKQYSVIWDQPLMYYTVEGFHRLSWIKYIIVVVSKDYVHWMEEFVTKYSFSKVHVAVGADTRHRSIYNGIKMVETVCPKPDIVLIHDAVRIFAEEELVKQIALSAKLHGAAGVTRPLVSTVVAVGPDKHLAKSLDRSLYRCSEMPQAFQYNLITNAYNKCTEDDFLYGTECLLLALKYSNVKAHIIEGNASLWKVTHKRDLYAAEGILKEKLNMTYLVNMKHDTKLCSIFKKHFKDKYLKTIVSTLDKVVFENSLLNTIVDFVDKDRLLQDNILEIYRNIFSTTLSHIKMIVLICQVEANNEILQIFPKVSEKCRDHAKYLLQNHKTILNVILTVENEEETLGQMCADIVWNRSKSLNGQTFILN